MTDEILPAGVPASPPTPTAERRLVPMQVGSATVYVEQVGAPPEVEATDAIYPVALTPEEAFNKASELIRECVRVVGERVEALAEKRPQEVSVEFSVTFAVKGKASLIPVFVTGETGAETGLKVKAIWQRSEARGG